MDTTKEELLKFVLTSTNKINCHAVKQEYFRKHGKLELWDYLLDSTKHLSDNYTISEKLLFIKNNWQAKFCQLNDCNNPVKIQGWKEDKHLGDYCSIECSRKNASNFGYDRSLQNQEKINQTRKQTNLKKFGVSSNHYLEEPLPEQFDYLKFLDKNNNPSTLKFKKYTKSIINLTPNCSGDIKERIFWLIYKMLEPPTCSCGENCAFINFKEGYSRWCSISCKNKDIDVRKNISQKNSDNKIERAIKMKNTLMERYGVTAVCDIPGVKEKVITASLEYYDTIRRDTFSKYNVDIQLMSDHNYLNSICHNSSYPELSETHFKNMPIMTIYRHFEHIKFEPNFPKTSSSGERQIREFMKTLLPDFSENIHCNVRGIIGKLELDIYIPEHNLAIEYNGIFTHSEKCVDKVYHINKLKLCQDKNIRLLQFFEDEWILKRDIVKSIISYKLNKLTQRYNARDCIIRVVPKLVAEEFLDLNHLQGRVKGSHYGLYHEDLLVSLLSIGKRNIGIPGLELLRFCVKNNCIVNGGFGKLLNYIKQFYKEPIKTYADLRYSDGSLYTQFGRFSHQSEPGFSWVKNGKRINRMHTQKHKLEKFLGDKFIPELSETDNMEQAGYIKIWDCGQLCFEL